MRVIKVSIIASNILSQPLKFFDRNFFSLSSLAVDYMSVPSFLRRSEMDVWIPVVSQQGEDVTVNLLVLLSSCPGFSFQSASHLKTAPDRQVHWFHVDSFLSVAAIPSFFFYLDSIPFMWRKRGRKWREWEEFSGMKIDAEIRKWWWIFSKRQINESSSKVFGRKQKQTETTLTECEMSCGLLSFLHPSSLSHFPSLLLMRNVVDTLWKGAKMAFKYFTFKVDDGKSEEKSRNYCHFSLCFQGRWSRNEATFT